MHLSFAAHRLPLSPCRRGQPQDLGKEKRRKGLVAEVPYYIQMGKNSQNNHTYCPMAETVVGNHNNK